MKKVLILTSLFAISMAQAEVNEITKQVSCTGEQIGAQVEYTARIKGGGAHFFGATNGNVTIGFESMSKTSCAMFESSDQKLEISCLGHAFNISNKPARLLFHLEGDLGTATYQRIDNETGNFSEPIPMNCQTKTL